jgi:LuxR family maltose regulon positive regulatory protein
MTLLDSAGPLLETKFYVPRLRRGVVPRPRLNERLSRGAESKLTLISAPAGFGKTTLLAEWLSTVPAGRQSVAWLSLDQADNQPVSFWTYLITALQTAVPGIGAGALAVLHEPQPPPIETVLAPLLNELGAAATDIVLVLDDDHVVEAHDVQDGMAFLLDHLPPRVHLVIATRADPALPLARLRGRGELVEIRAADLRFTAEEAAAYLNDVMDLDLTARDIAALEGRTEGWIAALQLAALSIQGRDDIAGFIAGFAGDDRYIVDYLVEEVLQRQPEEVRRFLLQTSILGRLSARLCDAVTVHDDGNGKAMLEILDRGNLFLVSLDDRRRWYRYHQLFADVLRAHLLDEQPDLVPVLHRRASEWFEQNGERFEAIRHALAGTDYDRAASLIELSIPAMRQARQEAAALGWLETLPDEVIQARPVLNVHFAGALLSNGRLEGVEARLRDAERWLDTTQEVHTQPSVPSTAMVVVDEEEFRRLPGAIAIYRAAQAQAVGDVAGTIEYARQARDLVEDDDHLRRGSAAAFLGLTYWRNGELEAASRAWTEATANLLRAGHVSDVIGGTLAVADILIAQGRLRDAMVAYERGLKLATDGGGPVLRGAADMHVGMSGLWREYGDLDEAMQHLLASEALGDQASMPQNAHRSRIAMARVREAQGDLQGAIDLLDEAERVYRADYFPNMQPIAALRTRLWLGQGRLGEAFAWARDQSLSVDDELTYEGQFEHISFARALLAQAVLSGENGSLRAVADFLERLLAAAEEGAWTGSNIEILVLTALAHQAHGDVPAALVTLERALVLAEPEGYVRIFVDEGAPMAILLRAAAKRGIAPASVGRLQAAFGGREDIAPVDRPLVEPLSERELDVLRLLASDLDGPDIARELVVSLSTVRTHTQNIYTKLGVNSRRAAVRRAAELGLLSRSGDRRP